MALILKGLWGGYQFLFEELGNPEIKDWFLMSTPFPALAILGVYLWFIIDYGPRFMDQRKPFKLDRIIQTYNLIQIALSFYTFFKFMRHGWGGRYDWRCEATATNLSDPDDYMVASMAHLYFLTKVVDLLDTVFFILRKKYNQVSFLHLYHHAGMVAMSWGIVKWFSTGHATMLMTINSLVHTIMYAYYYVTSQYPEYRNNLWWKKYITKIQLAQFLFLCVFYGQVVLHNPCNFPGFALAVVIPQNLFILVLFSDFYYKTYIKKKPGKAS